MHHSIISDLLMRLNNAKIGHYKSIYIIGTKISLLLIELFEELGIIRGYRFLEDNNAIEVFLKYVKSVAVFNSIIQISKPHKRIYVDLVKLTKLKERRSKIIYILSTSKGIFLDIDCVRKKLAGEVLLKIIL